MRSVVRGLTILAILFVISFFAALVAAKSSNRGGSESQFVFGASSKTTVVNLTPKRGLNLTKFNLTRDISTGLAIALGYEPKDHVLTVFFNSTAYYSIFSTDKGIVGVLWNIREGNPIVMGKEDIKLVLVTNETGRTTIIGEGNSTIIKGYSSQTYRVESKLMPKELSERTYVHEGDSYVQWWYLNTKMAELHAEAKFYILYGQTITRIDDESYDWTLLYSVTRCSFSHYAEGTGSIAGFVRADGHYMFCLIQLSRHSYMGAWYSVDVWLNTDHDGYGWDSGTFGCSC